MLNFSIARHVSFLPVSTESKSYFASVLTFDDKLVLLKFTASDDDEPVSFLVIFKKRNIKL